MGIAQWEGMVEVEAARYKQAIPALSPCTEQKPLYMCDAVFNSEYKKAAHTSRILNTEFALRGLKLFLSEQNMSECFLT